MAAALRNGTAIDAADDQGNTLLHIAALNDCMALIKVRAWHRKL